MNFAAPTEEKSTSLSLLESSESRSSNLSAAIGVGLVARLVNVTLADPTVTVSPAASPRVVFPLNVLGPATVTLVIVVVPRATPPTVPMVAAPVLRKVPEFVISRWSV